MKFKIDQNLPLEFETILAASGHDAISVFNQITADLDLSDIRTYPPQESAGYIVFRLKDQTRPKQIALLKELLPALGRQPLEGKLWIVEEGKLRVRG